MIYRSSLFRCQSLFACIFFSLVTGRIFFYSPHCTSGQQRHQLKRRLNLSTKRQPSIGITEHSSLSLFPVYHLFSSQLTSCLIINSMSSLFVSKEKRTCEFSSYICSQVYIIIFLSLSLSLLLILFFSFFYDKQFMKRKKKMVNMLIDV